MPSFLCLSFKVDGRAAGRLALPWAGRYHAPCSLAQPLFIALTVGRRSSCLNTAHGRLASFLGFHSLTRTISLLPAVLLFSNSPSVSFLSFLFGAFIPHPLSPSDSPSPLWSPHPALSCLSCSSLCSFLPSLPTSFSLPLTHLCNLGPIFL